MAHKAPGRVHRKGITLMELAARFPDEEAARKWFEAQLWPAERCCGHCGSTRTTEASHKTMPYWCSDCRSYFSVKTGTALAASNVKLRKWVWAIYLELTSLKGVSSMKLHRDIGVSQKTAWFMLHRIREAFTRPGDAFTGPVEVDETYMGGREKKRSEGPAPAREALQEVTTAQGQAAGIPTAPSFPSRHWPIPSMSTIVFNSLCSLQ